MVFGAGAVAAGAFRASIVVTARLRAVAAIRQLTSVLLTSNNAFIRFGRSALIASGAIEVLRRTLGLVTHPITGLLALLQTGLATRRWLQFEQATRSARVQLSLMGLQTAEVNRRMSELTARIGRLAAKELFQASLSLAQFFDPRISEDLGRAIQDIIDDFSVITSIDPETLRRILTGLKLGGEEALAAIRLIKDFFPGLIEEGDKLNDIFEKLRKEGERIASEESLSQWEKLRKKLDEINDILDPFLGRLGDLSATLILVIATITEFKLGLLRDVFRDIKEIFTDLKDIFNDFATLFGELILDILALDFSIIGEQWNKVWDGIRNRIPNIIENIANVFTGGFNNLVGDLGEMVGVWIRTKLVPAITQVFSEDFPKAARAFFGEGLGKIINDYAKSSWKFFWDKIMPSHVTGFIEDMVTNFTTFFTDTLPGIFSNVSTAIKDALEGPLLATLDFLRARLEDIIALFNSIPFLPDIPVQPSPTPTPTPSPPPTGDPPGEGDILPGPGDNPPVEPPTDVGISPGGGPGFPIPPTGDEGINTPLGVINVFIGEEKLDTILVNRLTKIAKRQGLSPRSMRSL